jgi:4-amino-4-deoxy-L-arabinose transferase-like glycosyltransferase
MAFRLILVTLPDMLTGTRILSRPVALSLLALLVLGYFSLFHQLGRQHMNLWDESSYALNALEMVERGDPIEVYLEGQPDLYNSKPPFAIWCMALSVKVLGFNEFAVRLPAALFGLGSTLLLFVFGLRVFRDPLVALAAPFVLISSTGFISEHGARTGDTDAILAFWILFYCACFFFYTRGGKRAQLFLFLSALGVTFACLTKGIAGLTALPGLLVWAAYTRKIKDIFTSKWFYAGVMLFIVAVPGYYLLRNHYTPGYIDAVLHFELGGRLGRQEFLNPEPRPFYFFYKAMLADGRLNTWLIALPLSLLLIWWPGRKNEASHAGAFFTVALFGVSLSLAASSTKLYWYDMPMYPLIAGLVGSAVATLSAHVASQRKEILACFGIVFLFPYITVVNNNLNWDNKLHIREAMRDVRGKLNFKDPYYILDLDHTFPIRFYMKQDTMQGYTSTLAYPIDTFLVPGTYFLTCKWEREVDMQNVYILDTLYRYEECAFFRIRERRPQTALNP